MTARRRRPDEFEEAVRVLDAKEPPRIRELRRKLRASQARANQCRDRIAALYARGDEATAVKAKAELIRQCDMQSRIVDDIMRIRQESQS